MANIDEMRFKPIWKIKNIPLLYRKVAKTEIIRCWNLYADRTNNGLIDKWNEEFDALYGKRDNYDIPEYNEFMRKRGQEVANMMTNEKVSKYLTGFKINEDHMLTAKLKFHPKSFITFVMKLVH